MTTKRPPSVTLGLGSRQPETIDDPRLVTLFWKMWLVRADILALDCGQVTVNVGRGGELTVEVPKRV